MLTTVQVSTSDIDTHINHAVLKWSDASYVAVTNCSFRRPQCDFTYIM